MTDMIYNSATLVTSKPADSTWTDEQWEAISRQGHNLLVAAAAGSGKTAVLVERIIRRISDEAEPVDVDRLLVATFTKAAAEEMKERIREALQRKLEAEPQSDHLRRQLALMGRASVTTLHSFCMEIVQRYYTTIGLDPGFRIANETENELLMQETVELLLETYYENSSEDSAFWQLIDSFGNDRGDGPLIAIILKLYELSRSQPWPEHWLHEIAAMFRLDDQESQPLQFWLEKLKPAIQLELQAAADLLRQALQIAELPNGPSPYIETLQTELDEVSRLAELVDGSWSELQSAIVSMPARRLKPCRGDDIDSELKEQASQARKQAKETLDQLRTELFGRTEAEFAEEIRLLAPMMDMLVQLVIEFGRQYQTAKASKGLLDFSDLEHYALAILRHPDSTPDQIIPSQAALDYQAHFVEVLVDEYQDTNKVQEAILELISESNPGNRFMVGDVKQSIYKFRLAEPELFLEKYKNYSSANGATGQKIDLARNFRSREEVVNAVNFIFRQIMNERVGEIAYDQAAELVFGSGYYPAAEQNYAAEIMLIDRSELAGEEEDSSTECSGEGMDNETSITDDNPNPDETEELKTAQAEARAIAGKIHELMGMGTSKRFAVYDKQIKGTRPIQYRDIVILLRGIAGWAPAFVEELQRQGIPAYAELSTGYFSATEVETMMSLLKIIDNPFQDVPLAAVLRSSIIGLSADELAQIRIKGGMQRSFFESICHMVAGEAANEQEGAEMLTASDATGAHAHVLSNEELADKLRSFLSRLERWRTEARQGSLADLIGNLYRETGYYDEVGALPQGMQRQANLRALHDRAKQYESTSLRGLFRFLRFIERMKQSGGDLGTARALGEGEDVVRLMSIHKSKGLEFPVVFVAGIAKKFNATDMRSAFLIHKDMGFGPRFVDVELRAAYPTLPQLAIRKQMKLEMLAEEMRILYVALTRAREKLFLVGTVKDPERQMAKWSQVSSCDSWNLPDHALSRANHYLDWLGPALMRHRQAGNWHEWAGSEPQFSNVEVASDESQWTLHLISIRDLQHSNTPAQEGEAADQRLAAVLAGHRVSDLDQSNIAHQLRNQLEWKYPYSQASQLSGKTSVSELKRLAESAAIRTENSEREADRWFQGSALLRRPRFMEEKKLTPAERGTLYHTVMQNLPITSVPDEEVILSTLDRLVQLEIMTDHQRQVLDVQVIRSFFETSIGRRMVNAHRVQREVPFSFGLKAGDIHQDIDANTADEVVLIQGVIDCLFEDEHGLVLLDYKTDRTLGLSREELAERYRLQIALYAKAVSHIYKKPVDEQYVYFFDGGELIPMENV